MIAFRRNNQSDTFSVWPLFSSCHRLAVKNCDDGKKHSSEQPEAVKAYKQVIDKAQNIYLAASLSLTKSMSTEILITKRGDVYFLSISVSLPW